MVDKNDTTGWKTTAEMFEKIISKPKLVEKYLSKPPPKYIYDIVINTMEATKFPKGLYSDSELNPDNFKNNDCFNERINFLQKAVDITKIVLGKKIDVKVKNMRNYNLLLILIYFLFNKIIVFIISIRIRTGQN